MKTKIRNQRPDDRSQGAGGGARETVFEYGDSLSLLPGDTSPSETGMPRYDSFKPQSYNEPHGKHWLEWMALGFLMSVSWVRGQDYSLDRYSIDGGGGASTGGMYAISGTLGQPDSGKMAGGNYAVEGGFWSVVAAIQTPGAPSLTITLTPGVSDIIISWPTSGEGWRLQENEDLSKTNWLGVAQTPQDVGGRCQVVIAGPVGTRFYRLHRE